MTIYPFARPAMHGADAATTPVLHSLELFTGAGGLALGTHLAGFRHRALVEWNKDACETLRINAAADAVPGIEEWRIIEGDARTVSVAEFGSVDLIAGGPPCQPFSIAGKHRGMDDARNMIPQFVRAIRDLRPRVFILENVRGLLRRGFQEYFSYVVLELTFPSITRKPAETWVDHLRRLEAVRARGQPHDLRYNVAFRLLNAADYGVPQVRERVFLVGLRSDAQIDWRFPPPTHGRDALMYDQWVTGDYWKRHSISAPDEGPVQRRNGGTQLAMGPPPPVLPWVTVRDAIGGLPEPRADEEVEGLFDHRLIPGARTYVGHTGSPLDLPAKTLKAGDHGVPGGENMIAYPDGRVRYFTVREAARIQTFPDTWRVQGVWSEAMRQLGNAVPVMLAHAVAASVVAATRGIDHRVRDMQTA